MCVCVYMYVSKYVHKENPTRCNRVSKFLFHIFMKLNMFWGHTAHHQEAKTALAASGFSYMDSCWTSNNPPRMQNQRLLVQV